jgi:hypothetical protein
MIHNFNIIDVIRDGYKSIRGDSRLLVFILIYLLLPLLFGGYMSIMDYRISGNVTSDILGGIGLFAGLMFTLLFVVTSNYKNRKEQLSGSNEDENVNYIKRYHSFTEDAVSLISFSIVKAGMVIIITIVYVSVLPENAGEQGCSLLIRILNGILIMQLLQFLMIIVRILKEMYAMLYDDISK